MHLLVWYRLVQPYGRMVTWTETMRWCSKAYEMRETDITIAATVLGSGGTAGFWVKYRRVDQ